MTENGTDGTHERWQYEQKRAAERAHDKHTDFLFRMNEAANIAANNGLRALIIINGGAVIAFLAFIGHLIAIEDREYVNSLDALSSPLIYFAWGIALGAIAMVGAYLATYLTAFSAHLEEYIYEHPYTRSTGKSKCVGSIASAVQIIALIVAISSLVIFVLGIYEIREVIVCLAARCL